MPSDRLKTALLDLGLEDWIPLPEAMTEPEVVAATAEDETETAVREALIALLRDERIAIYKGRWDQDSEPVDQAAAIVLLRESIWYRYRLDDDDEQRLYYVNVENIDTGALLAEYKATATAWDLAQRNSETANPLFDRLYKIAGELRQTDTGRRGITALTSDPNAGVRLIAAAHSLRWGSAEGIDALEQLAGGRGLHALTAKYTLKEFRAGTLRTDW